VFTGTQHCCFRCYDGLVVVIGSLLIMAVSLHHKSRVVSCVVSCSLRFPTIVVHHHKQKQKLHIHYKQLHVTCRARVRVTNSGHVPMITTRLFRTGVENCFSSLDMGDALLCAFPRGGATRTRPNRTDALLEPGCTRGVRAQYL